MVSKLEQRASAPTFINTVVNGFSNQVARGAVSTLFTAPLWLAKKSTAADWVGCALISGTVVGLTDSLIRKVANKLLSPFYSEHASKPAKLIGTVATIVSRNALPLVLPQIIMPMVTPHVNMTNVLKSAFPSDIDFHVLMNAAWVAGAIGLVSSALYLDKPATATAVAQNPVTTQSQKPSFEVGYTSSSYTTEKFVNTVLKNQECETDLSRQDLIQALANPVNGLLERYGFLKLDLNNLPHVFSTCFWRRVIVDNNVELKSFVYY